MFDDIYRGKNVLVTGHNGFKGTWLSLWLSRLGADITGISLPPEQPDNHLDLLKLDIKNYHQDVRDPDGIKRLFKKASPEIVFHLAAQPLVRSSYEDPLKTWSTNVMGTANVLDACRDTPSVNAIVVVTSDKCYENKESLRGYKENDRLGGHDPYSASKAGTELVVSSYRNSFFNTPTAATLATVRAGNVIGGGDQSKDRLIPDIVRSIIHKTLLKIRYPKATRPWQHVLEPLSGYLMLGQKLFEGDRRYAGAWNFGPDKSGNQTVEWVLKKTKEFWPAFEWQNSKKQQLHEANLLQLDSSKAKNDLGWNPVFTLEDALFETMEWYRQWHVKSCVITNHQLDTYIKKCQLGEG